MACVFFFFSSRRRHTRLQGDWSSDVCSSDLALALRLEELRDVLPLVERRRMPRRAAMLEICLVVGHPEHPAQDVTPGPAALCRTLPPCAVVSPPSHIPSPHMAPRARRPSCDATRPATTRATT